MSRPFLTRLHERLADRFDFIQYPNVQGQRLGFWKHQMPFGVRVLIIVLSLVWTAFWIGVTMMLAYVIFYSLTH